MGGELTGWPGVVSSILLTMCPMCSGHDPMCPHVGHHTRRSGIHGWTVGPAVTQTLLWKIVYSQNKGNYFGAPRLRKYFYDSSGKNLVLRLREKLFVLYGCEVFHLCSLDFILTDGGWFLSIKKIKLYFCCISASLNRVKI